MQRWPPLLNVPKYDALSAFPENGHSRPTAIGCYKNFSITAKSSKKDEDNSRYILKTNK